MRTRKRLPLRLRSSRLVSGDSGRITRHPDIGSRLPAVYQAPVPFDGLIPKQRPVARCVMAEKWAFVPLTIIEIAGGVSFQPTR
jgi:hypothetical protein